MKQDYKKTTYACFIGYIVQAIGQQLCSAVVRDIPENIPDSADEDHTAYHNQFCDTASD